MRPGKLARALALAPLLFTGCLTEPSANAPAANSSAAAKANRATAEASPTPAAPSGLAAFKAGKLDNYISAATSGLAQEQREAMGRVNGDGRRLLALRGYLRAGDSAATRWAWSRERIEAYEKSPEYAAALAEIEKVRREFERANPGYTLRVNTQVRSLDEQLSKWNDNDSVARAGEELLGRARSWTGGLTPWCRPRLRWRSSGSSCAARRRA
ncbi:MAG TPA: hypothetical protein VN282_26010 [Pyrinomonadaceae bacterium]|nr:hypothetical protein [Pyrinomonadaceae bacterium]